MTVLSAIVGAVLPSFPAVDVVSRQAVEQDVADYVAAQINAMPGFLGGPYQLVLVLFGWLPLLRYGRPFADLPERQRNDWLRAWETAPLLQMRDFLKLIRSTALFVYFDHPDVRQRLETDRRHADAKALTQGADV